MPFNELIYSNKKASDIVLCKCDMDIIIERILSLSFWKIIVANGLALPVSNAEIIFSGRLAFEMILSGGLN